MPCNFSQSNKHCIFLQQGQSIFLASFLQYPHLHQPSLTKHRLELLQYAKEKLAAVKEIKFPYADMHGNLKVVLNTPIRNRYVVGFKTKEDVGQILASLGTDDYERISYEEY